MLSRLQSRTARLVGYGLSLAAMALAALRRWEDIRLVELPSGWRVSSSLVLAACSVAFMALAWAALYASATTRSARVPSLLAFLRSQMHKYLPGGGAVQVYSQISGSRKAASVERSESLWLFSWSLVVLLAGGSFVAGALSDFAIGFRLALLVGTLTPWLLRGLINQTATSEDQWFARYSSPGARTLLAATTASGAGFVAFGMSFVLLLDAAGLTSVGAVVLSWLAGFLAIPFPAGLGIRELTLTGLLESSLSFESVYVATLVHRLVTISADGVVVLVAGIVAGRLK